MPKEKNWGVDQRSTKNRDEYSVKNRRKDGLALLKRLGKFGHIKHMRPAFPWLPGIGGAIRFESSLPDALLGAIDGVVHLDDPDVQEVLSRLDTNTQEDQQMAKRVVNLKRTAVSQQPVH